MRLFFPLAFIVLSIVLFLLVVNPLYGEMQALQNDVATYNLALNNSKDLQERRDTLLRTYRDISQEDKDRLDHFLPNTVNNIKFILEVEQVANLHNMPIKNIKFDPQKTEASAQGTATGPAAGTAIASGVSESRPYGVFPIEFVTEGNYGTFVDFLKDLEHNLRLVDVKSIGFTVPPPLLKAGTGPDPSVFTYTLKVDTYWLK
jgi:hypothetical protein